MLSVVVFVASVLMAAAQALPGADSPALRRTITVAGPANFPPFFMQDPEGRPTGSRVEAWLAWQEATGIEVEFLLDDWGVALSAFEAGEADVMDSIVATAKRRETMRFSEPFITIHSSLFYSAEMLGITDLDSARSLVIGVMTRDACEEFLRAAGFDALRAYPDPASLIEAAAAGEVRVFCMLEHQAWYLLGQRNLLDRFRAAPPLYVAQGRWAVRKGDDPLFLTVEAGFRAIPPDRWRELDQKWYGRSLEESGDRGRSDWLLQLAAILLGGVALALLWAYALRRKVRREMASREGAERWLAKRVREAQTTHWAFEAVKDNVRDIAGMASLLARDLPEGFWFPKHAYARVRLGDTCCDLIGTRPIVASMTIPVLVDGRPYGEVTVVYDALSPEQEKGDAFLAEEDRMMRLIAGRIGDQIARQRVQDSLALSEERFRLVTEVTRDVYFDIDLATGAFWVNDNYRSVIGEIPEEFDDLRAALLARAVPEDREIVQAGLFGGGQGR
ncbi:transporter substrate-binding domain-containing protein [Rhodovulum bhavnagarense]|nr:transporter substrate-binding domain-containing protein [Rhodovulum bhavnagarense]